MKKLLFGIVLMLSTVCVNAQYGGVIRAVTDAGVLGEIKRDGFGLKVADSLLRIRITAMNLKMDSLLAEIRARDSSNMSRKGMVVLNTVPISGTVTSTSDSTTGSRLGVKLLVNPTITNDSNTLSRKGVVLLQNPTIANTTFSVTGTFWQATQPVSGTVAATQSGTWNINNVSGTISLPTGAATSAKQPDFGTAGTPSGDIITIQGRTSMTPVETRIQDSVRVYATNGFGGSSGGTSLDAVDSTNLAGINTKLGDTLKIKFTRLKAATDTVAIAGSITATAGATAIYDSTWTAVAMDTAGLGAKASSATVGWQTDTIGLRQHKVTDMKLGVKISFANSTPGSDKACFIYAVPWWYDGSSTWYAASGGTTTLPSGANSSYTIAQPNDFVLLGVLSYTTQNQVCQRQFNLSNVFGNTLPDAVSFVIINSTGAAIHTSGNLLYYSLTQRTQR